MRRHDFRCSRKRGKNGDRGKQQSNGMSNHDVFACMGIHL